MRAREVLQLLHDVEILVAHVAVEQRRRFGKTCIGRRSLAALVFSGQQPARQREERQDAEIVGLCGGKQILLVVADDQAVFVLTGHESMGIDAACHELCFCDAPCRKVRAADVTHLALTDQVFQRAQGFLDRRQRIEIVLLIEIDIVGLQAAQTVFHCTYDVAARCTLFGAVVAHGLRVFRREYDVLAAITEHFTQHGFRAAASGIDVGGVEQRDAKVDRLVNDLARCFQVGALAEVVAAEADSRHAQARAAQISDFHDS